MAQISEKIFLIKNVHRMKIIEGVQNAPTFWEGRFAKFFLSSIEDYWKMIDLYMILYYVSTLCPEQNYIAGFFKIIGHWVMIKITMKSIIKHYKVIYYPIMYICVYNIHRSESVYRFLFFLNTKKIRKNVHRNNLMNMRDRVQIRMLHIKK